MTEAEWLACAEPKKVTSHLGRMFSDRKLRLFAVACCRRVGHLMKPANREGLELAELYVDGRAAADELDAFVQRVKGSDYSQPMACVEANSAAIQPCLISPSFDGSYAAYFAAIYADLAAYHERNAQDEERVEQVRLLRCVFGNPFRPVTFSPDWRTSTATDIARGMYESCDFSAMPILADALQDTGCENADILDHCRGPVPHVRGCWVVDLVLGKE